MCAAVLLLLAVLVPQGPVPQGADEVLATFVLDGKRTAITRTDVALEMAFHLRRRERGQQATEQLVATAVTRAAAAKKDLAPSEAEVRSFWQELQDQFRAAGHRAEDFAAIRNTTEKQLFDDLAVQLMQQRLVRVELGLDQKAAVSGDMLKLWLDEEKKKHAIVVAADELPVGAAARIDTTEVPLIDLGQLLLRTAEDAEREKFVRQVAYLQTIEALGRREGVQVTPADLDASIQKRKDDAARDPTYRGATFESMLSAMGLTPASVRELRTFRAQILLDKITRLRFPGPALVAELTNARAAVLERVGARRRIGLIFVRASDEPNGLIPRTFDQARVHLEGVRQRLQKDTWEHVARIESEHASSKMQGGDTGWHRRRSDRLPDDMLAAAFALPAGEVSMPLQSQEGCYLIKALEVEPEPADDVLLQRLRESKAQELERQLLVDAKVEFTGRAGRSGKDAAK